MSHARSWHTYVAAAWLAWPHKAAADLASTTAAPAAASFLTAADAHCLMLSDPISGSLSTT